MKNIRYHFYTFTEDDGPGRVEVRAGIPGAFFTDDDEFIPFNDLGYNSDRGYFQLSRYDSFVNECDSSNPETIHPYAADDDWKAYIWMDEAGIPHMLGTRAQCADLYQALHDLLFHDQYEKNDPVGDNDPVWGGDYTIDQAADRAHEFDPEVYPPGENPTKKRIRRACQEYRIGGVWKTLSGAWKIPQFEFEQWLNDASAHKSGPKVKGAQ